MRLSELNNDELKVLLSQGVNLKPQGVDNYVFAKEEALKVIDLLSSLGHPILGGDVYEKSKETFEVTYDNWYCNQEAGESLEDFIFRSCLASKAYIESYKIPSCGNKYFALVARRAETA